MLKKQTVWLLTMLSLMIVLSVYYMMIDKGENQAYIDTGQGEPASKETPNVNNNNNGNDADGNQNLNNDTNNPDDSADVSDFINLGQDELFTMFRMELKNERSKKIGYLDDILISASATTDEKNEALNNINKISEMETKEFILQNSIMSKDDKYKDVLVRSEQDMVYVHVMTNELSEEEAIDIMQLVKSEFGEVPVDVRYN